MRNCDKCKMSEKRKRENEAEKPACKYGEKCYRRNPIHLETYSHPGIMAFARGWVGWVGFVG